MGTLQFIDSMTGRLAWPLAAVLLGFVFRRPLTELLDRVRRLKWGEKEAELAALAEATRDVEDAVEKASRPLPGDAEESSQQNRERIERLVRDAASWGFSVGKVGDRADLPRMSIDWNDVGSPHLVFGCRDRDLDHLILVHPSPPIRTDVLLRQIKQEIRRHKLKRDDDDGPDPIGVPT